jgi:hypothetical protein
MSLVLQSSGGGSVTIAEPTTASNFTQNLPAADGAVMISPQALTIPNVTGIVMVSGNMPAFSAYTTSSQVIGAASATKILFPTEEFDTNNNFASSRFTPTVAGYYQLNVSVGISGGATTQQLVSIYRNGAVYKHMQDANSSTYGLIGGALVNANGTTDYFEIFVYSQTGFTIINIAEYTWFDGCMVRGA